MANDPLVDLKALYPGIQEEEILKACNRFSLNMPVGLGDDEMRDSLDHLWIPVNKLLKQDQSLNRPLATLSEFHDNVKVKGEDSFFSLLRARAAEVKASGFVTRWAPLFREDVFLSTREDQAVRQRIVDKCHCACVEQRFRR